MAKPKSKSKKKDLFYKCPHCDLVVDFPVMWCTVGEHHMSVGADEEHGKPAHPGICNHCYEGLSDKGRDWRRKNRTWAPHPFFKSSWDDPEWYDGAEEWKNNLIQSVWNEDVYTIEEFRDH